MIRFVVGFLVQFSLQFSLQGTIHKVRHHFLGVGGCHMLTLDDMRGVGVSTFMTSATFENPTLFFLESSFAQN